MQPLTATGERVEWDDFDAEQQDIWEGAARLFLRREGGLALLAEVAHACLYEDDDFTGITQEPHISEDLFDRICAAIKTSVEPQPRAPQTEREGSRDDLKTDHPTSTTRGE